MLQRPQDPGQACLSHQIIEKGHLDPLPAGHGPRSAQQWCQQHLGALSPGPHQQVIGEKEAPGKGSYQAHQS